MQAPFFSAPGLSLRIKVDDESPTLAITVLSLSALLSAKGRKRMWHYEISSMLLTPTTEMGLVPTILPFVNVRTWFRRSFWLTIQITKSPFLSLAGHSISFVKLHMYMALCLAVACAKQTFTLTIAKISNNKRFIIPQFFN